MSASSTGWTYRPKRAVFGPIVLIAVILVVFGWFWLQLSDAERAAWRVSEKITVALIALVPAWVGYRLATIRVTLKPEGLVIRNALRSNRLTWDQVKALRYEPSDAWLQLITTDDKRIGVLAIQRADGPRTPAAVSRFVNYAREHGAGGR